VKLYDEVVTGLVNDQIVSKQLVLIGPRHDNASVYMTAQSSKALGYSTRRSSRFPSN
jgi:hypothetical protein